MNIFCDQKSLWFISKWRMHSDESFLQRMLLTNIRFWRKVKVAKLHQENMVSPKTQFHIGRKNSRKMFPKSGKDYKQLPMKRWILLCAMVKECKAAIFQSILRWKPDAKSLGFDDLQASDGWLGWWTKQCQLQNIFR